MISIIIPVFNCENYLPYCIDSVINQTYKDLEIIIVDDGSTDGSAMICDKYSKIDSRIKVIHKKNTGLMNSWKVGVLNSFGEYVCFVDSDDWIDSDMYEKMLRTMNETKCDIVSSSLLKEYGNKTRKENQAIIGNVFGRNGIETHIFPILFYDNKYNNRGLLPNRVVKMIKRTLILKILNDCDDNITIGEDLLTTFLLVNEANSICCLDNWYPYHYRIHSTSMIGQYSIGNINKIKLLKEKLLKIDSSLSYDFSIQIHTDYIHLFLLEVDKLILYSNKPRKDIVALINRIISDSSFIESLNKCNYKKLSIKDRVYLSLIKHDNIKSIIFLRNLKR